MNSICFGQNNLKQLTTEDGLSEIQCFDIYQDSQGYMWIGTSAGANKYDGKDIVKFDRSSGLLSDHIYSFHEDSQHRIWMNNLNGEPLFIKNNKVHNRFTDPYLESIKGDGHFIAWCEDGLDRIWFGEFDGTIHILDRDGKVITIDKPESSEPIKFTLSGIFPYQDEIIVSSSESIKSIDPETLETSWDYPIPYTKHLLRKLIYEDKLYLLGLFDTYLFDLKTKKFKRIERRDGTPPIYDCRVIYDEVFISTSQGISILRDSIIEEYYLDPSLDSISISALHEDFHGDLWIATLENGVYSYSSTDVEKSKFSEYPNIGLIEEFSEDSIFIIQEDWTISLIENDSLIWKIPLNRVDDNRFNNVFFIDGELWVADKYQIHIDVGGSNQLFSTYNREIIYKEDTRTIYWIGTAGLSILEDVEAILEYEDLQRLKDSENEHLRFINIKWSYDFEFDKNENIWVGAEGGLFFIKDEEKTRIELPELEGSITKLRVKDNFVIGVNYGTGLFDYNMTTGEASLLTKVDGLPASHFANMDMQGDNVWVSHATGICLLRKDNDKLRLIKNFGREHGIPNGKITLLKVVDEICHFVVNGNTYSIKPDQVINDTIEVLMDQQPLTFYTNESRTINFDCINFTFGNKLKYFYKLTPLDSIWKETNGEKVDLEHIPAGEYQLEIKAQHPLNLVSPIKRKQINVEKRWYNENYFRAIVLLLFGFLIYFLFRIKAISFNSANFKHWIWSIIQKYFVKEQSNSFNIKDINGVVHLLNINDVRYIKSSGNYLEFHTNEKKYVSRMTMSSAVEKFKVWTDLQRVHRSYMVNLKKIEAVDHKMLKVGNMNVPFTETYKDLIEKKLKL